jgi:hypothetical protein
LLPVLIGSLFVFLSFFVPTPALASNKESKEKAAKRACLEGDYVRGVAILSDLYADTNDPNYIYNGGRCFEQNGRYAEAILRFREYLRKARSGGDVDKADAEAHIVECQSLMGKAGGDSASPLVQPAKPPPAPAPPAALTESPAPIREPSAAVAGAAANTDVHKRLPVTATASGSGLRTAGIAVMAVGGAGLVTGLLLNLHANSLARQLEETTDNYQRSEETRRAREVTYGWIGYGVGGACLAGGVILYYLGRHVGQSNASTVALLPSLTSGHTGAVLAGTFQ